jgi:phage terminase large subunit-like protein
VYFDLAYSRDEDFAEWCSNFLVQSTDQFAGKPLVLEKWQLDFIREALATRDEDGLEPVWRSVALIVSRKNGKTAMLAAYALFRLLNDETQPEILLAAASDKQAGRLFDACMQYIRQNTLLADQLVLRDYIGEIARADGGGKILRMASSADNLHGYNPSLVVCDELHAWTKPSQRKAWAALTTGGGARKNTQVFTITTAGDASDREAGILGRMINRNEAVGDVERLDGLTISRNFDAATLVYNYSAPTKDPSDTAAMKLANPASWITTDFLARQAANPELSAEEVLQLHGCVWVSGGNAWIQPEWWNNAIERDVMIPDGARVSLGVDIGIIHDASAVVVAWQRPDDERVVLEARVWTPRPGQNVQLGDVEDHIRALAQRLNVAGVFYDPRFFEASSQRLDDEGIVMVNMPQNSATMANAYQTFYSMMSEGQLVHAGNDEVFTQHVLSTGAVLSDRGWRVSKMRQTQRIDALVAAVMATYGAAVQSEAQVVPGFFVV